MSVTTKILTADVFATLTGETASAQTEEVIDATISALNIFNCGVPMLSGTTPNKTVTLTSQQYGAVIMILRTIYVNYTEKITDLQTLGVGSLSGASYAETLSNPGNMQIIHDIAWQLKPRGILRTFG